YDEVECPLPAVVTVTAGAVEPRYPSFRGIVAARAKPVEQLSVADLGLSPEEVGRAGARQEVMTVAAAEGRGGGQVVEDDGDGHQRIIAFLEERKIV
ncbi:MAG: electron transfer flavoprotein subunit alpha, partial [Acidimicrobiales bacterium]|nr:electron transfer flavoprotein subunit alpha [Acidimicrobiales bacterium]